MPVVTIINSVECVKMTKVDLGAGTLCQNKIDRYKRYMGEEYNPQDYIGVDCYENNGIDKICNFETERLPFDDDSVDAIITMHTLEHIHNLVHIIKECYRILKSQATLKIWVPHCHSTCAFSEMHHVRFFSLGTFDTFDIKGSNPKHPYQNFLFEKIAAKLQVCKMQFEIKWHDKILENLLNKKPARGERILRGLPYKDWEVFYDLKKP